MVVIDESDFASASGDALRKAGFDVLERKACGVGSENVNMFAPDAVLLDLRGPGAPYEDLLRRFQRLGSGLPVIVLTADGSITRAVSAMRAGAFEYVAKPCSDENLAKIVRRAVDQRRAARVPACSSVSAAMMASMGRSAAVMKLIQQVETVANTDFSVVIEGETGAGKELIASTLHQYSRRAGRPLVVVDCGSVSESLIDSEFFGHEKGAYTGAIGRHRGWFETAGNGGTIFLDEIGNLPQSGQKAFLRTIEQRVIHRVGGTETINLDLRVVAATNDNLRDRVRTGGFREDLFYRLCEYVISVPPLRSRPEDIPFLARRFLAQGRASLGREVGDFTSAALDQLCAYRWPGNARELRNVVRRAALHAADMIESQHLMDFFAQGVTQTPSIPDAPIYTPSLRHRVQDHVRAVEREAVVCALEQAKGNKAEAARLLGIDYKTYRTKLKNVGKVPEGLCQ